MMPAAITQVLFGKLPDRPDFLRVNATHPVAFEVDCLIQAAMERIGERYLSLPVIRQVRRSVCVIWLIALGKL